jgi:intracellular multiplication protein IcmP
MSQGEKKDSTQDMLWVLVAVVGIILLVWYVWGNEIKYFYLTYRLMQIKIITTFLPLDTLLEYNNLIETRNVAKWTFDELNIVGGYVGYFIGIIPAIYLGWKGYMVFKRNPIEKFKRVLTMQTLKESEVSLWPYIAPVIDIDFISKDFFKGPFAMAQRPYDFCLKYKLLEDERNVATLDKNKATKLFISQLGRTYNGLDSLKKHEKAFIAICAAYGLGKKEEAMAVINEIALSSRGLAFNKLPNVDAAKDLYKFLEDREVKYTLSKSAYVYPTIMNMVEFARQTGVFPSSFFIWLKPRDRTMWYCVNCVGRNTPYVEVTGIWGHWLAEKVGDKKRNVPYVKNAVAGLEKALSEVKLGKKKEYVD